VLWLVIELAAALDLGLGFSEIVIRPLVAQPVEPQLVARIVVLAVCALAALRMVRRPRDRDGEVLVGSPSTSTSTDPRDGAALAASLQSLRRSLAWPPSGATPLAVHLGDRIVEIFWDRPPPPPPAPWRATPSGWVWEAARAELEAHPPEPELELLPALVTVGSTPTGVLWLNLEAFRAVSLLGDPSGVERLARHLLAQLRRSASAGALDLQLLPGTRDTRPAPFDASPPRDAAHRARDGTSLLTRRARRQDRDGARPRVVAVAPGLPALAVRDLIDRSRLDAACTCIVLGPVPEAELSLTCQDDEVRVPFLDAVRVRLDGPDWRASDAAEPAKPKLANPAPPPVQDGSEDQPTPLPAHDRAPLDEGAAVEVRVLGPVEVRGSPERLAGKSLELVAYLALHPDGAHEDQIRAALWPDRPLHANSWATRVSITRRALGRGSDGRPRLARFRDHVGWLTSDVRVDLDPLTEALAHPDDPAGLHAALTSVRGRPFDVARGFEWAHRESHLAAAERLVVAAAHQLSTLALAVGDWSQARWATERGLCACPDSEILHQDHRQAVAAGGDSAPTQPSLHESPNNPGEADPSDAQRRDALALDELLHRAAPSDPR
jgi:hypothetical protein